MTRHGYHIVQLRPWPIVASTGAFAATVGFVNWFHGGGIGIIVIRALVLGVTMLGW